MLRLEISAWVRFISSASPGPTGRGISSQSSPASFSAFSTAGVCQVTSGGSRWTVPIR